MSNQTVTIEPNQRYHLLYEQSRYASVRENISELGAFDSANDPTLELSNFMNLLTDAARALCGVAESSKALKAVVNAVNALPVDYEQWHSLATIIDWYLEPFKPSSWNQVKPAKPESEDKKPLEKMDSHVHVLAGFLAGHLLVSYCLLPGEDLSIVAHVIERGLVAGFKYLDIDMLTRELKGLKVQS